MKKRQQKMDQLPLADELWLHIFSFFDYKQLAKAERVCKSWEKIIKTDSLWTYPGKYHNKREYLLYFKELQHRTNLEAKKLILTRENLKKIDFFCIGNQRDDFFKAYTNDIYKKNLVSDQVRIKNYTIKIWRSKNHKYYDSSSSVLIEKNAILLVFSDSEEEIKKLKALNDAFDNKKIVFLIKPTQSEFSKEITSMFSNVFNFSTSDLSSSADALNDVLVSIVSHLEKLAGLMEKPEKNKCSLM